MELKQAKIDAEFVFMQSDRPETRSDAFPGVLHLYEINYDPDTTFWGGVADICCGDADYCQRQQALDCGDFTIDVELADGRLGLCRHLNVYQFTDHEFNTSYTRVAMIGYTTLEIARWPGEGKTGS